MPRETRIIQGEWVPFLPQDDGLPVGDLMADAKVAVDWENDLVLCITGPRPAAEDDAEHQTVGGDTMVDFCLGYVVIPRMKEQIGS